MAAAIGDFLTFDPPHHERVVDIADGAAAQAAAVGSGRSVVLAPCPWRRSAVLAAREWIRHGYTDYGAQFDTSYGDGLLLDELAYPTVKTAGNQAVDDFIAVHRKAP